jgi:phage gp46-like protein
MSDLRLIWDPLLGAADLGVEANDLVREDGLETAVLMSLFTDRRAADTDVLPSGETDRRGWWADAFPVAEGDLVGSRLWLLAREKDAATVRSRAAEYAREALQWMLDDRVADSLEVAVEVPRAGWLVLDITIRRPQTDPVKYRFNAAWAAQEA